MRLKSIAILVPAVFAVTSASVRAADLKEPKLAEYTSSPIQTLTMDTQVVQEIRAELSRIEGDFKEAYRFHRVSIAYMQPDKLQFQSVVAGAHITYTINGPNKYTSIPTFHVHKTEDTTGSPGKKQSLLDVGLVPPELLRDYNGKFLRKEGSLLVFQISPKIRSERFFDIVWIDPTTRITSKREHHNQDGKLIAWYQYKNPLKVMANVYMPTRVEVFNPLNHLAAVTAYKNIKVNGPVDSSIFDF